MRSPVEAFDSGSNYSFGDKMEKAKFPRSVFNLGHLVGTTIDNCGQVQVLDVIETLPGDDHDLNIRSLIRCLPSVVPLYSRQRIYIYAFWSRYSDLWANWNTFMTKGYDGKTIKTVPVYDKTKNLVVEEGATVKAGSLADGFGIQQGISAEMIEGLNCFDAMQLLRIFRDYFLNKNFYVLDRVLLPDDDSRFRLGDDGQLLSAVDAGVSFKFELCSDSFEGYQVDPDTGARTFSQFCHDWPQDYFTSGLPWPQRGVAASLDATLSSSHFEPVAIYSQPDRKLGIFSIGELDSDPSVSPHQPIAFAFKNWNPTGQYTPDYVIPHSYMSGIAHKTHGNYFNIGEEANVQAKAPEINASVDSGVSHFHHLGVSFSGVEGHTTIILQQLRELAVEQKELEKMARTDGSYAEFGLTFFSEKSKNAIDYRPVYIGGTYDNISYSEVLQTSAQYAEQSGQYKPVGSPLGTYGGHGIGSANGYIGHIHCDDYGQIMILACIMPDVYYNTGLERRLTNKYQSDFFLPERAKLGLRPTLKKELNYTGVSDVDDDLFNYQNIFDEYRYLPNRIKGKLANSSFEYFYPYTQSRKFESTPEFNHEFAEASNVRKDYLQAPSEVAFTAQFAIEDRAVRALPYKAIPADILN